MIRALVGHAVHWVPLLGVVLSLGCENDPRLVGLETIRGAAGSSSEAEAGLGGGSPSTGGAPGTDSSVEVIRFTGEDAGKTVSASVGQEINITLQTIGAGQFATTPELSSPVLAFIDMSFPPVQNPGGPTQLYRFSAISSGTVVIAIKHTATDSVFTLTVTVM